ncbi:MAG: hypothetical protein QME75_15795 [Deltaproteobacteria bacterium]|nr:hypothetical protein [Deltaproteobacteria bacterium]
MESRRLAARRELERRYLDLLGAAESLGLETNTGLLEATRLVLGRPLDPETFKAQVHLSKAFDILGKSFFRQAPAALQTEVRRYAGHLEAVCQQYERLGDRLLAAQKIIDIFSREPEFDRVQAYRLALVSPEAAELFYHLRQKRLAGRQARLNSLVQGWRTRLATCQRWLALLRESLPAGTFKQIDRNLKDLAESAPGEDEGSIPKLLADHAKLDLLISVANRQATRAIAGLLRQKSN